MDSLGLRAPFCFQKEAKTEASLSSGPNTTAEILGPPAIVDLLFLLLALVIRLRAWPKRPVAVQKNGLTRTSHIGFATAAFGGIVSKFEWHAFKWVCLQMGMGQQ